MKADQRGAALVEGVIVLPFFVLALAFLHFLYASYSAKLDTNEVARHCAWTYAVSGCDRIPPGCSVSDLPESKFKNVREMAHSSEAESMVSNSVGYAGTVFRQILRLKRGIQAKAHKRVDRPAVLAGHSIDITAAYGVMCNERSRSLAEILSGLWCGLGGRFGC